MNDHASVDTVQNVYWQDQCFWLAVLLAPLCWLCMVLLGLPTRAFDHAIPWRLLLWIALIYPLLEEFVFRGGIQAALHKKPAFTHAICGISLANFLVSLAFAGLHLFNQPPLWGALVFFPSLVFGWMRDRYHHIKASVALHVWYNAGFVMLFSA